MNSFSREDLKTLMDPREGLCVSLYQPTHRPAAQTEQDRIRFKNLLRQAEESLIDHGLRGQAARDLLEPGQALLDDSLFWQHQSEGLAVFLSKEMARYHSLPVAFDELVVVGERFHVRPLLPVLTGDGRYYILALSQNEVRLFQATRHGVDEVELPGVPESLAEALKYDDPQKQLQFHTRAPQRGGERAAMFHGHGQAHGEDPKDRLLRYFRAIDAGIRDLLRDDHAPLVLAGVDYYFPIYRKANTYPHLLDKGVPGSPMELRPYELHREAWEIVRPHFEKANRDALDHYQLMMGTGRTSTSIEEVLPAARHGRVDTLLVSPEGQLWGTFDLDRGQIQMHQEPRPGDEDLLELAVLHTLSNSGQVYPEERSHMPDGSVLAAVFRY